MLWKRLLIPLPVLILPVLAAMAGSRTMFSMSLIPALMLAPALFTRGAGGSPGPSSDGDGGGGGGGGGSRPPTPPRGGPGGGGIPLPDAQPARTRRRDHVRPARTTLRRGAHPHPPARTPVKAPADV